MRESETPVARVARQMRSSRLHHGAKNYPNKYVAAARAWWPEKTAEHWAQRAGVKPRIAKAWLAGDVSPRGKLAIIRELD